jgi:signal transduction histidine kinase
MPRCLAIIGCSRTRKRLKQILLNLLSNAVKYNRVGGRVEVSCELVEPKRLRINVTDTGPGIRPADVSSVFIPFERLGAERTDTEGSSIGLALSRRLAEAMNGSLDFTTSFGGEHLLGRTALGPTRGPGHGLRAD